MARVNKNQPVDSMFAYNVAKDIANIENEVEELKSLPSPQGLEFGNERIEVNGLVYRKVENPEYIKLIQTGYKNNKNWYGDRPDNGYWNDPFTKQVYQRHDGEDFEVVLPSVEQVKKLSFNFEFESYGMQKGFPLSDEAHVLDMNFEEFKQLSGEAELWEFEDVERGYKNKSLINNYISDRTNIPFKVYYRGVEVYSGTTSTVTE